MSDVQVLVDPSRRFEGVQLALPSQCRRCVIARRSSAWSVCDFMRPCSADFISLAVFNAFAQARQCVRPRPIEAPQFLQKLSGRGGLIDGASGGAFLASRRCNCVSLVGGRCSGAPGLLLQSARETSSAIGATARPQVGTVSERPAAKVPVRRQLPLRSSKNHSRLSVS